MSLFSRGFAAWPRLACFALLPLAAAQVIGDPGPSQLNVLFLVEVIAIYVVLVGLCFFFDRLVGLVVGFVLRILLWKSHRVHVSIGSLQISVLAGRILFRDLRYHSSNMSIRVLKGHITWRYWIWKVKTEGVGDETLEVSGSSDSIKPPKRLPARGVLYVEGLEWFLYNRTPAFDNIVERMRKQDETATDFKTPGAPKEGDNDDLKRRRTWKTDGSGEDPLLDGRPRESSSDPPCESKSYPIRAFGLMAVFSPASESSDSPKNLPRPPSAHHPEPPAPAWQWERDLLPFDILVNAGAVVIGNDATPTVVVAEFKRARLCQTTRDSRSRFDLYRQVTNAKFAGVTVLLRTNPDYVGPILELGKRAEEKLDRSDPDIKARPREERATRSAFHRLAKLHRLLAMPLMSRHPFQYYDSSEQWKGLPRYRKDTWGEALPDVQRTEYAKVTRLLEAPDLDMVYYSDVPGAVPPAGEQTDATGRSRIDIGNGDAPPEWGTDLIIHNGKLVYGPWADRQRDTFQKAFLPSVFFHSDPTRRLQPGDTRRHTELRINVELQGTTTLRMPTREPSKDWQHQNEKPGAAVRKYGWVDVHIGPNSSFRYISPIVADLNGYDTMLELHFDTIAASSSVNYRDFLTAKSCRVLAQMPTPLQWNGRRDWVFDVSMDHAKILLLRDHTTLLTDLAKDWSSGPQGGFFHFLPCDYQFQIKLTRPTIGLYLNDFNIVDDPADLDNNCILYLTGPQVTAEVEIPLIRFRPESTTIPFNIAGSDLSLSISLPKWHTHRSFATERTHDFGKVGSLALRGSYLYYASVDPEHTETLSLFFELNQVRFRLLGWVVRRLLLVKDNYFGTFTNFMLSSEFLQRFQTGAERMGDPIEQKYRPGKSDRFEVNLDLSITEGLVLMPTEIYDCQRAIILPVPALDLHLRSTEGFMELAINADPTGFFVEKNSSSQFENLVSRSSSPPLLSMDGLQISANRLFGPQPRALTYLCLWEIQVGSLGGRFGFDFAQDLLAAVRAFGFNFADRDNVPLQVYMPPADPDATFVRVQLGAVDVSLSDEPLLLNLSLPSGVAVNTNSLAAKHFATSTHIGIPEVSAKLLANRHVREHASYQELASVTADLVIDTFSVPSNLEAIAAEQQAFLSREDAPTHRLGPLVRSLQRNVYHSGPLFLACPLEADLDVDDYSEVSSISTDASSILKSLYRGRAMSISSSASSVSSAQVVPTPRSSRQQYSGWNTSEDSSSDTDDGASLSSRSSGESFETIMDAERQDGMPPRLFAHYARDPLLQDLCSWSLSEEAGISVSEVASKKTSRKRNLEGVEVQALSNVVRTPCKQTIWRIRSADVLQMTVSPPGVAGLLDVKQVWEDSERSVHRILDRLLIDQVAAARGDASHGSEAVLLDVNVPGARLFSLQQAGTYGTGSTLCQVALGATSIRGENVKENDPTNRAMARSSQHWQLQIAEVKLFEPMRQSSVRAASPVPECRYLVKVSRLCASFSAIDQLRKNVAVGVQDLQAAMTSKDVVALRSSTEHWLSLADTARASIAGRKPTSQTNDVLNLAFSDASSSRSHEVVNIGFMTESNRLFHPPYEADLDELDEEDVVPNPGTSRAAALQSSIREDSGWKVLAFLRQRLWDANEAKVRPEANCETASTPTDWLTVVDGLRGWRGWDIEPDLADLSFLKDLPGHPAASQFKAVATATDSVTISIDQAAVYVLNTSQVVVTSLAIAQVRASILKQITKNDQYVICAGGIRMATSVALFDIVNQLPRAFFEKKSSARRADATSQDKRSDLLVTIDRTELLAEADGLRAAVVVSASSLVTRSGVKSEQLSVSFGDLETSVSVAEDDADHKLITISLRKSDCLATLSSGQARAARVGLSINRVAVSSQTDPQETHRLASRWREINERRYVSLFKRLSDRFAKTRAKTPTSSDQKSSPPISATVTAAINAVNLNFAISADKSFFWDVGRITASGGASQASEEGVTKGSIRLRLGSQRFGFCQTSDVIIAREEAANTLVRLPSISTITDLALDPTEIRVTSHIVLDKFNGTFKPNVLDRALAAYKAVNRDIRSLSTLFVTIADQIKREVPKKVQTSDSDSVRIIKYAITIQSQGVRVLLKPSQPAPCVAIEASSFGGRLQGSTDSKVEDEIWRAQIDKLRLSLERDPATQHRPSLGDPTAYTTLSVLFDRRPGNDDVATKLSLINVHTADVHSVIQVTALAQVYDFMSTWSNDLAKLRQRRQEEWQDIVQNTNKLIQTETKAMQSHKKEEWLTTFVVHVKVDRIAIALPLALKPIPSDPHAAKTADIGAAFLFTITDITAMVRKGESLKAEMRDLMVQFVDTFYINAPESYIGVSHAPGNRVHLPISRAQAQHTRSKDGGWLTTVIGTFKGFELRLDHRILRFVQQFSDVFARGQDEIARFAAEYPIDMAQLKSSSDRPDCIASTPSKDAYKVSLNFYSGVVFLVSKQAAADLAEERMRSPTDRQGTPFGEVITLPGIALWIDGSKSKSSVGEKDILMNMMIHSSRNTMKPSILEYFADLDVHDRPIQHIRTASARLEPRAAAVAEQRISLLDSLAKWTEKSNVAFAVTINQSELTLSCKPDTPTLLVLAWQSGGVVGQVSPGAKLMSATIVMDTLSVRIGHEYLDAEHWMHADVEHLRGSLSCRQGSGGRRTVELVLDTKMTADAKLSRVHDVLCLQAVWIDRIPAFTAESATVDNAADAKIESEMDSPPVVASSSRQTDFIMLVQIQELSLTFAVFDAESKVVLAIRPIFARAKLTAGDSLKLSFDLRDIQIDGRVGKISGRVKNQKIVLTIDRQLADKQLIGDLLSLNILARDLEASLEHDAKLVFRLHLMPSRVSLRDDWADFNVQDAAEQKVKLSFDVRLGDLDVVFTVLSIPDSVRDMQEIASRWTLQIEEAVNTSAAYRVYRETKPVNAISAVTRAMQQSASDRRMTTTQSSVKIAQELALHLGRTTFGLYKQSLLDKESFRLDISEFMIGLTREHGDHVVERRFEGRLDGVRARRYDRRGDVSAKPSEVTIRDWLAKASKGSVIELVRLPRADVTMQSSERQSTPPALDYSYKIRWGSVGNVDIDFQIGVYQEVHKLYQDLHQNLLSVLPSATPNSSAIDAVKSREPKLVYQAIDLDIPNPRVGLIRDKAAEMLRPFEQRWKSMAPRLTHEFVAMLLESGMDTLLAIYERSLPTKRGH